jgi:hypothetical protein
MFEHGATVPASFDAARVRHVGSATPTGLEASGVGVVDHNKRTVFLGQVTDHIKPSHGAVHRKHTVGGNKLYACASGVSGDQLPL